MRYTILFLLSLVVQTLTSVSVADAGTTTGNQNDAGVGVSFSYQPQLHGAGVVSIAFQDAATGRSLEGMRPAAWMQLRRSEQVADEQTCEDKARSLMSGSIGARAGVDMNSYRLVTLNQDRTVAFINPHVGLQNSKLESIVELPSIGYDWVHSPQTQRLFVTLRDAGAVAVISTVSRKLIQIVSTGEGSLPTRLAMDEDTGRIWVGLDGTDEVLAIDATRASVLARVRVGQGVHTLSIAPGMPWLFVTNAQSNSVTLLERNGMEVKGHVLVGQTPVAAQWSALAQRLVVVSINAGELSLINPHTLMVESKVSLARGVVELGLFDNGRYALVLNTLGDALSLVDLSSTRVIADRNQLGKPDQIVFSREYAYVRSQASANVHVLALAQLRTGSLSGVAVPMGRQAPVDVASALNVAGVMTQAPERNGVLVANPGDGRVYSYAQGLMVPTGSFNNYRRQARALMVLDTSLRERAIGDFAVSVQFEKAGRYDLVVRNLRPAVTSCFTVLVEDAATPAPLDTPSRAVLSSSHGANGSALVLEFKVQDGQGQPLDVRDATVLVMGRTGHWQGRAVGESLGDGRYRAVVTAIVPGDYEALVQIPSAQIAYAQGRLGAVRWPLAPLPNATKEARQ
jgi:DNA-binding beta-propeller fold protein YncE